MENNLCVTAAKKCHLILLWINQKVFYFCVLKLYLWRKLYFPALYFRWLHTILSIVFRTVFTYTMQKSFLFRTFFLFCCTKYTFFHSICVTVLKTAEKYSFPHLFFFSYILCRNSFFFRSVFILLQTMQKRILFPTVFV